MFTCPDEACANVTPSHRVLCTQPQFHGQSAVVLRAFDHWKVWI